MSLKRSCLLIGLVLFIEAGTAVFGQTLVGGKWNVCTDMDYDENFSCPSSVLRLEFYADGTFREFTEHVVNSVRYDFFTGKWSLSSGKLMLDTDDYKMVKFPPNTVSILWLNKNMFYIKGQEGPDGPTVYTYYQRIEE